MSISALLDTSRKSLSTQTRAIQVIGDNVANVNTPGYTRRRADITTVINGDSVLTSGSGPQIDNIVRITDKFLNQEAVRRVGDRSKAQIKTEFLERAEGPFGLDGEAGTIGYQLNEFFGSLQDLAAAPANIPLRTQVLQTGSDLVFTINEAYNTVAQLQREADDRVGILVTDINRLSTNIAELNNQISQTEGGTTQEALTLRDQRDQLLGELGELVSFRTIEDADNKVTVYLENGFALVSGATSKDLTVTYSPSFAPVGGFPNGLDGQSLGHVTYDFGGNTHIDLTGIVAAGGGELAGVLEIRGVQGLTDTSTFDAQGDLVEVAARIEAIARDLLVNYNAQYVGPDESPTEPPAPANTHEPSSYDLDGNNPGPFGLFSYTGFNAAHDVGRVGLAEQGDLTTALAANAVSSFASALTFNVTSERSFAAGRDLDPATEGNIDRADGDSSNIDALLALRDTPVDYSTYNLSNLTANTTIEGLYSLTVSYVGGKSKRSQDDFFIFEDREAQILELQKGFSGVNLDEEFAKLIQFQRAFEASSRLINVGDELIGQLIDLFR